MSETCPRCDSPKVREVPKQLDEDRSWVGGYWEYDCGVHWWYERSFYTAETLTCIIRQRDKYAAELAALRTKLAEAERERDEAIESLGHMKWCASCAEGSWEDCDGGRAALELLKGADDGGH